MLNLHQSSFWKCSCGIICRWRVESTRKKDNNNAEEKRHNGSQTITQCRAI
ncbi:hypothetical protein Hanom_Chr05g00465881 [Helianthus anomalus]